MKEFQECWTNIGAIFLSHTNPLTCHKFESSKHLSAMTCLLLQDVKIADNEGIKLIWLTVIWSLVDPWCFEYITNWLTARSKRVIFWQRWHKDPRRYRWEFKRIHLGLRAIKLRILNGQFISALAMDNNLIAGTWSTLFALKKWIHQLWFLFSLYKCGFGLSLHH